MTVHSLPSRMTLGVAIMLALVLRWSIVHAQPTPTSPDAPSESQRAAARKLTDEAITAQEAKSYDVAIALYMEAYRLVPHPILLFNIGQTYRLAGSLEQAELFYRRYLEQDPDGPYAPIARDFIASLLAETADAEPVQRATMLKYAGYTLMSFGVLLGATGIRSIYQERGYVALGVGCVSLGLIGSGFVTYRYAKRQRQRRAAKAVTWSPVLGSGFAGVALTGALP